MGLTCGLASRVIRSLVKKMSRKSPPPPPSVPIELSTDWNAPVPCGSVDWQPRKPKRKGVFYDVNNFFPGVYDSDEFV